MPDFKAKLHQIQFRLGLRPRPRWGAYSATPDPLLDLRGPTSKGREGKGRRRGREGRGREKGKGGREKGEGRGGCVYCSGGLAPLLRTVYREQFYPKTMVPMESRDSEGVSFASLESL